MKLERKQLKYHARATLRAAWPKAYLLTLIYILITEGVAMGVQFTIGNPIERVLNFLMQGLTVDRALALALSRAGKVALFANILLLIYRAVMLFGYRNWALYTARGDASPEHLTNGFGMVWKVILLQLATFMHGLMWYVIIFMPVTFFMLVVLPVYSPVTVSALLVAAVVIYLLCILRYAMAPYCLIDQPEQGVFQALRRSCALMRGRAGELFMLLLSFAGWMLLCTVGSTVVEYVILMLSSNAEAALAAMYAGQTSLLAAIASTVCIWPLQGWLMPYMTLTQCGYYEKLRSITP